MEERSNFVFRPILLAEKLRQPWQASAISASSNAMQRHQTALHTTAGMAAPATTFQTVSPRSLAMVMAVSSIMSS